MEEREEELIEIGKYFEASLSALQFKLYTEPAFSGANFRWERPAEMSSLSGGDRFISFWLVEK